MSHAVVRRWGLVLGWGWHAKINKKWPMTHMKQHYWNVLALTQRHQKVSRAAQDRFASKSCPLSSSTTIHECPECIRPHSRFLFTLLPWVLQHIPDDYRNAVTTFMIVIITRPLHPCSHSSWENVTGLQFKKRKQLLPLVHQYET